MNPKLKKGLKIGLSVFVVIFATLIILPYAFRGKIMNVAKVKVNNMMNAKVDFENLNMSFIRSFPNASVKLENFKIIGVGEFAKDTLLFSEDVDLVLNLKSLFSDTGYEIQKLQFNHSRLFAHVLPTGKDNWSIMKTDTAQAVDTSAMSFKMKLKKFVIANADITYWDEAGKKKAVLHNLNHETSGDLTADSSLLKTKTTIDSLSFFMDKSEYLSKANVELLVDINANLNKKIFTFSENVSRINAIPFSFSGWFQMLKDGYDMDLKLNADKVDFKAILSMIPAIYANSFSDLKAGGKVDLSGFIKGKMVGDFYPAFDLKLSALNGWFQYPKLPKSLQNINVAARITNLGKTMDETVVDISNFSFVMGGNPFS
ncbi:MAG: AsmA family protein, partial [Paludibacter sp.]